MKCIITGAETENKWRGFPIKKEFVQLAKFMENEEGFKDCTMRERIIILQQRWRDRIKEEMKSPEFAPTPSLIDRIIMKFVETH